MRIGIFFESSPREGGAFHTNLNIVNIFKEYNHDKFDIHYIVTSKEIEKILVNKGCKILYFKPTLYFRFKLLLGKISIFKVLFKKYKIKNEFEKFLKKNSFDIIYFNSPTIFCTYLNEIPFVINIYELQHRTDNYFPEYRKSSHSLDKRDDIIIHAVKKAFKIILATKKDKIFLKELYNSYDGNINIQPYVPQLPNLYENEYKSDDFNKIFNFLNISGKKLFLYPAQFWAHKNHKYLVDIVKLLKKKGREDIKIILTGHDKGNKEYIKKLVKAENLTDSFYILEYVSDKDLISLYLNSSALIMPTFVGHSSLPLYEAFYFKLPVFFTKNLLDDTLKDLVYEIDIYNPQDFIDKLEDFGNNEKMKNDKLEKGKTFYNKNCSKTKLFKNLSEIFKEYEYLKERWS